MVWGAFVSSVFVLSLAGLKPQDAKQASLGCLDCHTQTDAHTMHASEAVVLGCTHCHGGDASIRAKGLEQNSIEWIDRQNKAHILPSQPEIFVSSANPPNSYARLNDESAEYIRFINPGDLRVAREACGDCHPHEVYAVERSLMTTSAMLWGGASYNNNILPFKKYILGESLTRDGEPRSISDPRWKEVESKGGLEKLLPLPAWEIVEPGDVFRVFENGGLNIKTTFPEIGNPNPFEESGKPDVRASNRGPGTGSRIAVPLINIHKTRLNNPHLSFLGTNDHPGDYRSSGCTGCHVIYANDRDERHSGPYSKFGHEGKTQTIDPMISKTESGHPLKHVFTRAIPTSQCMVCHMHQPNMFVNTYLGYTMWDYESDAPHLWPKEQKLPTHEETRAILEKNPEGAAVRGLWSDDEFLKNVSQLNPKLKDTQFADYHGHGWNFRAIYKRDRKGNLLDAKGNKVSFDDPQKFKKAVHLADIHLDKGMHCVDCHFSQDAHGDGHIYGEVAQAIEIDCVDCHGSAKARANLKASGPAAKPGRDFAMTKTPFGEARFFWKGDKLFQRSSLKEDVVWPVVQVVDTLNPRSEDYNAKAQRAKQIKSASGNYAHGNDKMTCFSCHSSWMTTCAGCHLPIEANWKTDTKVYEGKTTRNWATYNPQVARDDAFQLGVHGPAKDGRIAPVRSSSALILSSTDINRQKIYIQQPPTAASGHSSQAFAPHFPHTVRTTETKGCTDCHVSEAEDNNAILAQLFLLGTQFVNFMGHYVWVAEGDGGLEAIKVTEWDEPQAVIGSYLHRYAYPKFYDEHQKRGLELEEAHHHSGGGGSIQAIQLRGEYLHAVAQSGGYRVFDVANIANKGFSERIVTAPVSPLGQDTHIASKDASGLALPTTMPIAPFRKQLAENLETPLHPLYHYAAIVDAKEGLILVDVDTLQDGDPTNNFLKRALTWNENAVLSGARSITLAGSMAYVLTETRVVILDLDKPLAPRVITTLPFQNPKALAVQFRYVFVIDARGLHTLDVTNPRKPELVKGSLVEIKDARNLYLARTYAYVAAGAEGIVIADIEQPRRPKMFMMFNGDGQINDTHDVKVASTNASLFAYVADGKNGLWVLQLTDPERVPGFYGFSPPVKPKIIAHRQTRGPALAISKPLDRDRAVDETGHQVSVFGRIGSRPFTLEEMQRFFLRADGSVYKVRD
jgi:hypothetical protein